MWIKSLLCYIPLLLGIAYTSCPLSCSSKPDVQFGWIFHVPLDSTKVIPSLNHGFWRVFIQYSREEISLSNFIAPQKFSIDHGSMGQWVNRALPSKFWGPQVSGMAAAQNWLLTTKKRMLKNSYSSKYLLRLDQTLPAILTWTSPNWHYLRGQNHHQSTTNSTVGLTPERKTCKLRYSNWLPASSPWRKLAYE